MQNHTPQLPLLTIVRDDLPPIIPLPNRRIRDLSGQKFARLLVIGYVGRNKWNGVLWLCQCECGNFSSVRAGSLTRGRTKSCGCYNSIAATERGTTHGLSHTREYDTWYGVLRRCCNPTTAEYPHYGGSGIKMCERWRNNVTAFVEDMGLRPTRKHSIDRIDYSGHYSCGHCEECKREGWAANCRWATPIEQANNTCRNQFLEFDNQRMTIAQWARNIGISEETLRSRLRAGWSVERALMAPLQVPAVEFEGKRLNVTQWANLLGISRNILYNRLNNGWSIEKTLTTPAKNR